MKSNLYERQIDYPSEITFKSIFRNERDLFDDIRLAMLKTVGEGSITSKTSRNSKFISYTIKAVFSSDEQLRSTCIKVSEIAGFMMMF